MENRSMTPQQTMMMGFAIIILSGTILLNLPISSATAKSIGWTNALFTATSAVTLTGLTVLDIGTHFSIFGQIILLILVQLGGLGFMVFGVMFALLLGKRITLKNRLLIQETIKTFSLQNMAKLAMYMVYFTFLLEGLATMVLTFYWSTTLGWKTAAYQAIFHAISAFNNSGLSLYPHSLQAYIGDPLVNICITLLSILGGIGFTVLLDLYQGRSWKNISLHSKLVLLTSGLLILLGFVLILSIEVANPATLKNLTWGKRLWSAWFQAIAPRSSGFTTLPTSALLSPTLGCIMLLMFIGTSTGSTGGGVKVNTIAVVYIAIYNLIKGNQDVNVLKRRLDNHAVTSAMTILLLACGIIFLITWLLTWVEGIAHYNYLDTLFEVISAFGTVGLSMGLTPNLSTLGKIILIFTMFIGKLGPLTFAFALTARSIEKHIRYPEVKVLVG
jgi:trk system potassium uptake protein TrkH